MKISTKNDAAGFPGDPTLIFHGSPSLYGKRKGKTSKHNEKNRQIDIAGLNVQSYSWKKMQAELLIHLKERAGMTNRQIAQLDLFADLELSSLGCIDRRALLNRLG